MKKFRVKVDNAKSDHFFARLLEQVKSHSSELQRSKYDIDNLTIVPEPSPTVEENLMDENFKELESMDGVSLFHIEIKMKSSLDILSRSKMDELVRCFLSDKTDEEREAIASYLSTFRGKRKGAEFSQFFLRDLISLFDMQDSQKKSKKKSKNAFDGRAFFLEDAENRVQAIRSIADHESNYFRVFDGRGARLVFEEYDKVLSNMFSDWKASFCSVVSQSLSIELLRAVTFLQNIMSNSLGDSLVRLISLKYEEVKKEEGAAYLWTHARLIFSEVMEVLSEYDMSKPVDLEKDHYYEIKAKVAESLQKSGQTCEHLDLMVAYICLLTAMTFCDTSVVMKLAIRKDEPIKKTTHFESSPKLKLGKVDEGQHSYFYASKSTLIDFGAKKDSNLANLIETFRGLSHYSSYLKDTHGLN